MVQKVGCDIDIDTVRRSERMGEYLKRG